MLSSSVLWQQPLSDAPWPISSTGQSSLTPSLPSSWGVGALKSHIHNPPSWNCTTETNKNVSVAWDMLPLFHADQWGRLAQVSAIRWGCSRKRKHILGHWNKQTKHTLYTASLQILQKFALVLASHFLIISYISNHDPKQLSLKELCNFTDAQV